MSLFGFFGLEWGKKGEHRRPMGLLIHGAVAFALVGLPSYLFRVEPGPGESVDSGSGPVYGFGMGLLLTAAVAAGGLLKEAIECRVKGSPMNRLDLLPYGIDGLAAVLAIGVERGW